jgi:tetratricopeptide (TPR) repeat protein
MLPLLTLLFSEILLVSPLGAQSQTPALPTVQQPVVQSAGNSYSEPPQPKPSEAIQKHLEEAEELKGKRDYEGALKQAEAALTLARESHDAVGEACAHRERAIVFEQLQRVDEAVEEWKEAAVGWEALGDGPGRIEALGRAGQLLLRGKSGEAGALLEQALTLTRKETRRPLAATDALESVGKLIRAQGNQEWPKSMFEAGLAIRSHLAPDSLAVASSLHNLGNVAADHGDLKAAAEYYRRALAIREKLAPDSLIVAASLNNLGNVAYQQGGLKAAAEYYRRALAIRDKLAPESLDTAASLHSLGVVTYQQGDLKAATEYHRRALEIRQRLAPDSPAVAWSLHSLGNVAYQQGDLKAATEYHRRALEIRQRLAPDSLDVAANLLGLGNVAYQQGDLKAAAECYRRALAIEEKLAPDSLDVAWSLNNLGGVAKEQGDLKAAAEYHRRALAIRDRLAPDSLDVAASLNNLGVVAYDRGDLKAAAEYYRRALAIREKLAPDSLDVAGSLNNLGIVADDQGDLKAAAEYHRRALAIREKLAPDSLDVAVSLINLGNVASDQGDLKAAAEYYRRALAIEERLAPDSSVAATSLDNLGNVAAKQGDLKAAAEYHRRALAIREKLAPESLDVSESLENLGDVSHDQGELKAAAEYYRRALAIKDKLTPDSPMQATILNSLAVMARESGELDSAENLANHAWHIVRHQAEVVTSDEARQAFASSTQGYAGTLLSIQVARGEPAAALVTLDEGRAQGLARLLFERQDVLNQARGDLWPRHQEALAKLHHAEEALNQAEKAPGSSPEAEQQKQEARKGYQQARDEIDQLWAEIQKREPRAFTPTLNLAEAARTLGGEGAFVAFAIKDDEAYALALSGGTEGRVLAEKLQLVPAAGRTAAAKREAAKHLEKRILGFWDLSHTPPDSGAVSHAESLALVADGRELFDALFPGEIGKLVCRSKRLVLSPDGPLWQLPFAALVTVVDSNGNPRYLAERVALTYSPSLALYTQLRREAPQLKKGQRPEVLAVGDPDFDRKVELDPKDPEADRLWAGLYPPGARPARLRATAREAEAIAQLYAGNPLTGDQATEAEVRKRIEKADVIHLATHGSLQTALPMSSGIMLTPPANQPDIGETDNDGALQAWEIFSQLKLRAELVVLSACDTARGEVVKGEGVVGLTRALQYAGARSIVATQWSVASGETTTQLMEEFHKNLRKGEAKDEALKDAMAAVRKEHPQPFYWAPFILLGDPDNPNLGETHAN